VSHTFQTDRPPSATIPGLFSRAWGTNGHLSYDEDLHLYGTPVSATTTHTSSLSYFRPAQIFHRCLLDRSKRTSVSKVTMNFFLKSTLLAFVLSLANAKLQLSRLESSAVSWFAHGVGLRNLVSSRNKHAYPPFVPQNLLEKLQGTRSLNDAKHRGLMMMMYYKGDYKGVSVLRSLRVVAKPRH
jgi:hypothetical protein